MYVLLQILALLGGMFMACRLEASAATRIHQQMVILAPAMYALSKATPNLKANPNAPTFAASVL
jgi:hypothetical protein